MNNTCLHCGELLSNKRRKYCNNLCKSRYSNRRYQNYQAQQDRALSRKIQAINDRGGGCTHCGYNENLAALNFHHLNDKEFTVNMRTFSNNSLETVNRELLKCMLLCSNCHMTLHYPQLTGLLS